MARSDLVSLSLYSLLASNRSGVFLVYMPLFLTSPAEGASIPVALAIVSAAYVASSLLGPLAGRWSDKVGRRKPFLLAGEAGALPLFLLVAFVPGYLAAGLLFLAGMVVLSIGSPAYTAYAGDLSADKERGRAYGLLNAAAQGGGIVGFVITAVLISRYGYAALFPFVAAVMVGTVLVVLVLVPDRPVGRSGQRQPWAAYRPLLKFSTLVSIRSLGSGAVGSFFGLLAAELGADPLEIGVVAIAGLATGALTSIPLGRWVDRAGEIRGIWYGTLLTLGSIGIFLLAGQWSELIPAQVLRYSGFALLSTGMLAYVANRALPGHRAEDVGVFSLINSTFWSVGPLLGGFALALAGNVGLFVFAIATTVVSLLGIEVVYLARGRRGAPSPSLPAKAG